MLCFVEKEKKTVPSKPALFTLLAKAFPFFSGSLQSVFWKVLLFSLTLAVLPAVLHSQSWQRIKCRDSAHSTGCRCFRLG